MNTKASRIRQAIGHQVVLVTCDQSKVKGATKEVMNLFHQVRSGSFLLLCFLLLCFLCCET